MSKTLIKNVIEVKNLTGVRACARGGNKKRDFFTKLIEKMKPLIFYQKVVLMRKYQKEWFQKHSFGALNKARMIEREIDAEIERVEKIVTKKEVQKTISFEV